MMAVSYWTSHFKKIDFILPLYVEKPFASVLIRIMQMIGTAAKGFSFA